MINILFQKDQRVWWNDPAGETSDYYTIVSDVQKDIQELLADGGDDRTVYHDLIILLKHEQGGETQALVSELESTYEGSREMLQERETDLQHDMQAFILYHIRQNGGRISLKLPQTDDDWVNFEFPVTSVLYGKHFNDSVDITDVYINPGYSTIYADGQIEGSKQQGYQIHPEHYSDVLWFITSVLNLSESENTEGCTNKKYQKLLAKHDELDHKYFGAIQELLTTHGKESRVVFTPEGFTENDDITDYDEDFPVTITLWGKNDNPHVDITEVYFSLTTQKVYARGIDSGTGCLCDEDFEIFPEQYYSILCFLITVLRQQGVEI